MIKTAVNINQLDESYNHPKVVGSKWGHHIPRVLTMNGHETKQLMLLYFNEAPLDMEQVTGVFNSALYRISV